MAAKPLQGFSLLIVEDEYLLAEDLRGFLEDGGASIVGPVGDLNRAIELVEESPTIDCAIVDMNLAGISAEPLIDRLEAENVPVIICTGYDVAAIADRFAELPRCEKPFSANSLEPIIADLVRKHRASV